MPIEDRNLKPGTHLVGRYHKQNFTCEVVEGEGGKLRYRLADGREFKSPSAAGMAITGHACDGWAFWSLETATTAPPEVAQTPETMSNHEMPLSETQPEGEVQPIAETHEIIKSKAEQPSETQVPALEHAQATQESTPVRNRIFRIPNQKGVPEGQTRWYCHDCGKSFLVATGETPAACPQGHQAS